MTAAPRIPRYVLWIAVALLLGVRALVPSGWMPVTGEDGIRLALCSGSGPVSIALNRAGDSAEHDSSGGQDSPRDHCAFGVLATGGSLPGTPSLSLPLAPIAIAPVPFGTDEVGTYRHEPRPPSRGPPTLA